MAGKTFPPSISHDEVMIRRLRKDPAFVVAYLQAAMEDDEEPRVQLIALRQITEALGGTSEVARKAGVEQESLHRALLGRGSPRLSTLSAVAKAAGLRLTVEPA